jgi:ribosome-associated protein
VPHTKEKAATTTKRPGRTPAKPPAARAKNSTPKPASTISAHKKSALAKPAHAGAGREKPPHASRSLNRQSLRSVVIDALEELKALEIKVLDVRGLTDIADTMIIASGTSDRHVRSVAQRVVEKTKAAGYRPNGIEGQQDSDWVLIDLHDMIVHVMLPRVREFYGLEKLWDMTVAKRAAARA